MYALFAVSPTYVFELIFSPNLVITVLEMDMRSTIHNDEWRLTEPLRTKVYFWTLLFLQSHYSRVTSAAKMEGCMSMVLLRMLLREVRVWKRYRLTRAAAMWICKNGVYTGRGDEELQMYSDLVRAREGCMLFQRALLQAATRQWIETRVLSARWNEIRELLQEDNALSYM